MSHHLKENPFYILDLPAGSDMDTILGKASDMKLLYGYDTQDIQKQFLYPAGRLAAEIAYLPVTKEPEIRKIRDYLEGEPGTVAGYLPQPVPEISTESSLALFNTAAAFLQYWPIEDVEGAEAACLAMSGILERVNLDCAERVMHDINIDREAGNYEKLTDPRQVFAVLKEHVSDVLSQLADRCLLLGPEKYGELRLRLAHIYGSDSEEYRHLQVLSDLVRTHLAHSLMGERMEKEELIRASLDEYRKNEELIYADRTGTDGARRVRRLKARAALQNQRVDKICRELDDWNRLSLPERLIVLEGGFTEPQADQLFDDLNNLAVEMVNTWKERHHGRKLLKKLLEIFVDLSDSKKKLLEENARILGALEGGR